MVHLRQALIMSYTPNEIALLTFIKRVNETFSYFGEDGADYVSAEDMDYFKETVSYTHLTLPTSFLV